MGLFSPEEFHGRFIKALGEIAETTFTLVWEHIHRPTTGPRMSGIGSCGRKQAYAASQTPITNPRNPIDNWPSLLGGQGQQLSSHVLKQMGYTVTSEEETVTLSDGLITGHLDGELTGLDLEDEVVVWDSKFRNVWGLFGTKQSYGLVTHGLPYASLDIFLQLQAYLKARGRKRAIITAHPFDMSITKQQAAIKKMEALPAYRIVMDEDEEAQHLAISRAELVGAATKLNLTVSAEFDPYKDNFPCNYCEWKARCMVEGPSPITLPRVPDKWLNPAATQFKEMTGAS